MDPYYSRHEVSNSDLSALKRYFLGMDGMEPTEAYKFGRLIDCMITEPEKVNAYRLTCDGEQYSLDDFNRAKAMRASFYKDAFCREFVSKAQFQKIMSTTLHIDYAGYQFAMNVRCKWDIWLPVLGSGGDIKSTTATTQQQFEQACSYFDYDRQRAWYMDISGAKQDVLIGISKENFKVFKLFIKKGDDFYNSGKEKYEDLAFKWHMIFGGTAA